MDGVSRHFIYCVVSIAKIAVFMRLVKFTTLQLFQISVYFLRARRNTHCSKSGVKKTWFRALVLECNNQHSRMRIGVFNKSKSIKVRIDNQSILYNFKISAYAMSTKMLKVFPFFSQDQNQIISRTWTINRTRLFLTLSSWFHSPCRRPPWRTQGNLLLQNKSIFLLSNWYY